MAKQLATYLSDPARHWREMIEAFNQEILPHAVGLLNEDMSQHQLAKLLTERLPENERNLTDARTRIGVLLEYSLAMYLDQYVREAVGRSYRVGFVVANKFPDLIARDPDHLPLLRLEVKCIQSAAEEKSANLDVLLRDINPFHDLLVVLIWEWKASVRGRSQIEFPFVDRAFAFDAYTIAKVRDWGWLNEPTKNLRNDIDISSAVVGKQGTFKAEEKNLGKLMRIVDPAALERPPLSDFRDDLDVKEYLRFKRTVVELAITKFWDRIASKSGWTISQASPWSDAATLIRIGTAVDTRGNHVVAYFASDLRFAKYAQSAISQDLAAIRMDKCRILVLNEKFNWLLIEFDGGIFSGKQVGKKPATLFRTLAPPVS